MANFMEMITKFGFDIEEEKLDKLDKHFEGLEKHLEGIKHRLEFLAAIELAKGLAELTEKFAKFAEELHVAAENAGITVEAFQKLSFAAAQSGVTQEEMSGSMARLSRRLYEAKMGSKEAQEAFIKAGIGINAIAGIKNGQQALIAVSTSMQHMTDATQKSAVAMELMGRGGYHMVSFLSKGPGAIDALSSRAERLGVVLSEHQVEALVKAEHAFQEFWAVIKAVGAQIAAFLSPEIESAVDELLKFWEINQKIIMENIQGWLSDFSYALGFLWGILKIVSQAVFNFANEHRTLTKIILYTIVVMGILTTTIAVATRIWAVFATVIKVVKLAFEGLRLVMAGVEALALAIEAPIWLIVLAIAAAVLGIQAFWKVLNGGSFEDTWLGEMLGMLKGAGGKLLKMIGIDIGGGDTTGSAPAENAETSAASGVGKKGSILDMFAGGMNNMAGISGMPTGPVGISGGGETSNNIDVNAPITINVPEGTDPKMVGDKARMGVKDHMDEVMRHTQRTLRPTVAY